MAIPGLIGCFRCNGTDHWADNCPGLVPATTKAEHEERIAKYLEWCFELEPPRITPHQKRALIEHENQMWKKAQKEKEKAK